MAKAQTTWRKLAEAFVWDGVMPNLDEASRKVSEEFWQIVREIQASDKAKLEARRA